MKKYWIKNRRGYRSVVAKVIVKDDTAIVTIAGKAIVFLRGYFGWEATVKSNAVVRTAEALLNQNF